MDEKFKFKLDKDKIKLQLKALGEKISRKKVNRNLVLVFIFFALIVTGYVVYNNEEGANKDIIDLSVNQYDPPDLQIDYDEELSFYGDSERENQFSLNYPGLDGDPNFISQETIEDDSVSEAEEIEGVVTESLRPVNQIQLEERSIGLLKPVSSEIVQEPGWYYHTVLDDWRYQQGVEFSAEISDIVMAAAQGQVTSIKEDEYRGIMLIIEHENGWTTEYGHLERTSVSPGTRVSKGQEIGRVGITGMTSEPSLYFSLKNKDGAIDPQEFFQ